MHVSHCGRVHKADQGAEPWATYAPQKLSQVAGSISGEEGAGIETVGAAAAGEGGSKLELSRNDGASGGGHGGGSISGVAGSGVVSSVGGGGGGGGG